MAIITTKGNISLVKIRGQIEKDYYGIKIDGVLFHTPECIYPGDQNILRLFYALTIEDGFCFAHPPDHMDDSEDEISYDDTKLAPFGAVFNKP